MITTNRAPNDPRRPEDIAEDQKRADQYAPKGSLMHCLLSRGFFPHNEAEAEAILDGIIRENEENAR